MQRNLVLIALVLFISSSISLSQAQQDVSVTVYYLNGFKASEEENNFLGFTSLAQKELNDLEIQTLQKLIPSEPPTHDLISFAVFAPKFGVAIRGGLRLQTYSLQP